MIRAELPRRPERRRADRRRMAHRDRLAPIDAALFLALAALLLLAITAYGPTTYEDGSWTAGPFTGCTAGAPCDADRSPTP